MTGNHGRDTKKPSLKLTADRNWDMSVYLIAREHCRELDNVEWTLAPGIMYRKEVCGYGVMLTHSMQVSTVKRTPYYGIENDTRVQRTTRQGTDKQFLYAKFGHWHHHAVLDDNIIICPCMIGESQYSLYKMHKRTMARQLFEAYTEKHGLICQWPINLA